MNFEETHAAVEKAISARPRARAIAKAAGGGPLNQICSVYAIIKPILQAIESVPFFPKNWKKAIDDFITVVDKMCPSSAKAGTSGSSFEDVDKRVKDALVAHWSKSPKALAAPQGGIDLGGIAEEFCGVYKGIKPIIDFAQLFVPAAWKAGIIAFEIVADMICNPGPPQP